MFFDKFHPANELSDFNSVNIDFLASINVEKYYSKYDWRSFQFARYWAENNWNQQLNKEDSSAFENNIVFDEDEYYPYVFVNNEKVSCWEYAFYD